MREQELRWGEGLGGREVGFPNQMPLSEFLSWRQQPETEEAGARRIGFISCRRRRFFAAR